jgi:Arylmalonate decarboxylase
MLWHDRPLSFAGHLRQAWPHGRLPGFPQEVRRDRAVDQHLGAARIRGDAAARHHQSFRPYPHPQRSDPRRRRLQSETFWDGLEGSIRLRERVEARAGVKVAMGSDASQAALSRYGVRRVAVITPYMPVADGQVRRFFTDCGIEVVRLKGLKCSSPVLIAHVSERELRDALIEVDGPDVDAIMQVGTNLAMARLAGIAEFWLDKPVLAINTCIYWWALRQNGIDDKIDGFGSLLLEH